MKKSKSLFLLSVLLLISIIPIYSLENETLTNINRSWIISTGNVFTNEYIPCPDVNVNPPKNAIGLRYLDGEKVTLRYFLYSQDKFDKLIELNTNNEISTEEEVYNKITWIFNYDFPKAIKYMRVRLIGEDEWVYLPATTREYTIEKYGQPINQKLILQVAIEEGVWSYPIFLDSPSYYSALPDDTIEFVNSIYKIGENTKTEVSVYIPNNNIVTIYPSNYTNEQMGIVLKSLLNRYPDLDYFLYIKDKNSSVYNRTGN